MVTARHTIDKRCALLVGNLVGARRRGSCHSLCWMAVVFGAYASTNEKKQYARKNG